MSMLNRTCFAALAALVFASGCNSDRTAPTLADGTYDLLFVNGAALPTTVLVDGDEYEIESGSMILSPAGTCIGSLTVTEVATDETEVMSNTCLWTQSGAQLTITWTGGSVDTATISGRRISFVAQDLAGLLLVFER